MKFIHTSDLHIGKIVNGFSMMEEQKAVLDQIIFYAKEYEVDAVLLSGDLYDRSAPPAAAVSMMDDFLTRLTEERIKVLSIAGNHDCKERISFASRILEHRGLYMEGMLKEEICYVDFDDAWGSVRVHLLPFARPVEIRAFYRTPVRDYEEGMQECLKHMKLLKGERNILLTHQFVVNEGRQPELSDSESRVCVGGADQVDAGNFKPFDYVALGHIHGPQQIGRGPIYYSGSPVKYSFSEVSHEKSVILACLEEKGSLTVEYLPLTPVHDMRKIRGRLSDLIMPEVTALEDTEDYILAVLTNEEELVDPIGTLRSIYPNVMQLKWERKTHVQEGEIMYTRGLKDKSPLALFEDFFELVTGRELQEKTGQVVSLAIEKAKEDLL